MKPVAWVALLAAVATAAQGDIHDRDEQLVYSLTVFNGRGYSATFSAETSDTIYLLADLDNFLALRKTFVYYRPADDALKTDTTLLNATVDGFLEISGGAVDSQNLPLEDYTYYHLRGDGAANWRTATGPEAHLVYLDYAEKLRKYRSGMDDYRLDRATYDYMVDELKRRIQEQRQIGGDVAKLEEVLRGLAAPARPRFPEEYAAPPVRVDRAFVVNLPAGSYRARLVRRDGRVLEGSEKTIVAFGRFGEPTVAYEVIPGDRWNRPVESRSSGSVIYVDGSSDLYLIPYHQHEFTDLFYEKLVRNDARGSPGLRRRVSFQVIPEVRLAVPDRDGPITTIETLPYFVEQERSGSYGYRIVPFDAEGAHRNREPGFEAFHLEQDRYGTRMRIALVDSQGDVVGTSMRHVRLLEGSPSAGALAPLAFLPLAVGGGVWIVRLTTGRTRGRLGGDTGGAERCASR